MRSSRFYQNAVQIVGSASEVILFFTGFFLGKGCFLIAALLLAVRIANKVTVSELMYRRMQAVVREEGGAKTYQEKGEES